MKFTLLFYDTLCVVSLSLCLSVSLSLCVSLSCVCVCVHVQSSVGVVLPIRHYGVVRFVAGA